MFKGSVYYETPCVNKRSIQPSLLGFDPRTVQVMFRGGHGAVSQSVEANGRRVLHCLSDDPHTGQSHDRERHVTCATSGRPSDNIEHRLYWFEQNLFIHFNQQFNK